MTKLNFTRDFPTLGYDFIFYGFVADAIIEQIIDWCADRLDANEKPFWGRSGYRDAFFYVGFNDQARASEFRLRWQ